MYRIGGRGSFPAGGIGHPGAKWALQGASSGKGPTGSSPTVTPGQDQMWNRRMGRKGAENNSKDNI